MIPIGKRSSKRLLVISPLALVLSLITSLGHSGAREHPLAAALSIGIPIVITICVIVLGRRVMGRLGPGEPGRDVFRNFLTGPLVTAANDLSLWFADATGTLSLIVREGSAIEVAPGDTRILGDFFFDSGSGDEDGLPCGLNDLGQVAFYASSAAGSGFFIATPAISIKIKTINKTGNTVTITLDSFSGYTFRLQRSLSLTPAAFINIGSPQSGSTGSELTFTDPDATGDTAFYRGTAGP